MTETAEKTPLKTVEDVEFSTNDDRRPKYRWYQVNKDILPAKIAYFLDVARRIGALPNLVLFFTGIGLNKVDAGLILGFRYSEFLSLPFDLKNLKKREKK